MNESESQKTPPSPPPPSLKTECPACHTKHATPVNQCIQCGLIFSKWRDPKQRAAELKLASLSQEASQGLPKSVWAGLFLIFAVPAAVFFVPDIETRVLGIKLRYRPAKDQMISFEGKQQLTIKNTANQDVRYPVTLTINNEASVLEQGSGGNNTYQRRFPRASLSRMGDENLLVRDGIGEEKFMMGQRGDRIEMLNSVSESMKSNAANVNRLNQMRATQSERMNDRFYGATPQLTPNVNPVESDLAHTFLQSIDRQNLGFIDFSFLFHFPEKRLRSGFSWSERVRWPLLSPHLGIIVDQEIQFSIGGVERTSEGFLVSILWDSPVTGRISSIEPTWTELQPESICSGRSKGRALFNYKDGFVQSVEGETALSLPGQNGPLTLTAKNTIRRF